MDIYNNYYQFIKNPNIDTFNKFIKNTIEFGKVYKISKKKVENIFKLLKEKHLDSNGKLNIKPDRKGPLFSATCFPLKFILPTEDKLWITTQSGNKQVWKLKKDYDFKQTYNKNKGLETFVFNKKTLESEFKLKRVVSKLNMFGGKIGIGEYELHYEKVKSDYYSIWTVGGTLIAVPFGTKKDVILNALWKFTGYTVPIDGGTFGFHNGSIFNITRYKRFKKSNLFGEYIDSDYSMLNLDQYTEDHPWFKIYGKDTKKLENKKVDKWVNDNNLDSELLSYYHENMYGDGIFDVYKSNDMFLILSPNIHLLMIHLLATYLIKFDN